MLEFIKRIFSRKPEKSKSGSITITIPKESCILSITVKGSGGFVGIGLDKTNKDSYENLKVNNKKEIK